MVSTKSEDTSPATAGVPGSAGAGAARQSADWLSRLASLSPLFGFAKAGKWGGEAEVLQKIFSVVARRAGFAVEFGQRTIGSSTVSDLVAKQCWSALYMDMKVAVPETRATSEQTSIVLAHERVLPSNISALFEKHGVPVDLDCLVIDIDGLDYWVWEALDDRYQPSLVVVEYNRNVGPDILASIAPDDNWIYRSNKNYGASFAALCHLADRKGYDLVHVHGPWNLYFLKRGIEFPAALRVAPGVVRANFAELTDTVAFYDEFCGKGKRPSWFDSPAPDVTRAPWKIIGTPDRPTAATLPSP